MSSTSKNVGRARAGTTEAPWVRRTLIGIALLFVALFLVMPLAAVFTEALRKGFGAYVDGLREPDAWSAIRLTLIVAVIAVPLNLVFGVAAAWAVAKFEFPGKTILTTLTTTTSAGAGGEVVQVAGPESSRVVFPVPEGTWVLTSEYWPRVHPITGEDSFHTGTDFAAPDGTALLAAADGTVTVAEFSGGYGGLIVIEHTIGGQTVATAYAHMWEHGIHVQAGDTVTAGQKIGAVGTVGCECAEESHIHVEVKQGEAYLDPAKLPE